VTAAPDLEAFLSTLERLPPYTGVVFRGCEARSHERWPGRALVTSGLVAASRDPRVATENFTTEAVYAILSRTGRPIEQLSAARHEREVLFLPGTVLTLVTRARVDDLPVTIVEEFDPHRSDDEPPVDGHALQVEIGRAVLEARARPPVEPLRPGRLSGDIA
jgi:hypothetical protein